MRPDAPEPLAAAAVEVELVLAAAPLVLLELLPHAAIRQAVPSASSASETRLNGIWFLDDTRFLS